MQCSTHWRHILRKVSSLFKSGHETVQGGFKALFPLSGYTTLEHSWCSLLLFRCRMREGWEESSSRADMSTWKACTSAELVVLQYLEYDTHVFANWTRDAWISIEKCFWLVDMRRHVYRRRMCSIHRVALLYLDSEPEAAGETFAQSFFLLTVCEYLWAAT